MSHTQGEWKVLKLGDGDYAIKLPTWIKMGYGDRIATVHDVSINNEEADANAKLIAASPKLLRLLIKADDLLLGNKYYVDSFDRREIQEAIKSATE